MKKLFCLLFFLLSCISVFSQEKDTIWRNHKIAPFKFKNTIPADCPFIIDTSISFTFTDRFINYANCDTWYPTWASNDTLYSPWTDGYFLSTDRYEPFDNAHPGYACNSLDYMGRKAATAQAKIAGNDPMHLKVINIKPRVEASPEPYGGRYPCGSLLYNGIWYYGTYCLTDNMHNDCNHVGWTEIGPFVGFRISHDYGKTWIETNHTPESPLFGENPAIRKVKIGSPHFVDFGKNMQYSPDGYAYLTAGGSTDANSCNNWIQADETYLIRVKPSETNMNNENAYEFYAGKDINNKTIWTKNFREIKPLLTWKEHLGCVTMTYNPYLKKYLMCITRGVSNTDKLDSYTSMILISDRLDGVWKIAAYWEGFGPIGYFLNFPSKFIMNNETLWLCYSANFRKKNMKGNPDGSHYSLSLHEIKIKLTK